MVCLSQQLGEDHKTAALGKKKENGLQLYENANLPNPLNTCNPRKESLKSCGIAADFIKIRGGPSNDQTRGTIVKERLLNHSSYTTRISS